jgi:hypothetical protein
MVTMKNNTEKLEETKINISIRTGVMHHDKADEAQTRIDFTGYYIGAINYFLRAALEAQGHLSMQTESVVIENNEQFRENVQFLIQIQEALTEMLPDYSARLAQGLTAKPKTQVLDLSEQTEACQRLNLAAHLSAVMKDSLTPPQIYNCLSEYLMHIPADTDSTEWILGNLKIMSEDARNEK